METVPHLIRSVSADLATFSVTITWEDGSISTKAMGPLIASRKVFKPLADVALFASVRIINDGRGLAWKDDADMCADALWYDAHPQENPYASHISAAE